MVKKLSVTAQQDGKVDYVFEGWSPLAPFTQTVVEQLNILESIKNNILQQQFNYTQRLEIAINDIDRKNNKT